MFNPFRMFCFAPDGVPDGAPATDAENEREQHDDQQPETTEQTGDAAAKAAQTAAPAGKEQPVPKDEPKKDDKADDLAARVVTANARAVQAELRTAAALAGVPKERIPYVLRMCDTEGIDLDAADAQGKLDAAVAKVRWKPCRSCAAARVRAARATLPAETAAQRTRSTQRFGRTSWVLAKKERKRRWRTTLQRLT